MEKKKNDELKMLVGENKSIVIRLNFSEVDDSIPSVQKFMMRDDEGNILEDCVKEEYRINLKKWIREDHRNDSPFQERFSRFMRSKSLEEMKEIAEEDEDFEPLYKFAKKYVEDEKNMTKDHYDEDIEEKEEDDFDEDASFYESEPIQIIIRTSGLSES